MSDQTTPAPSVTQLMVAVMRDIGAVKKDRENVQQGFKFRGVDQVMNAVNAAMCKHGLMMTFEVLDRERELRTTAKGGTMNVVHLLVRYTFHGPAGDFVTTTAPGEAQDSGDKATNKALSAALKYALLHGFMIPTEDMEDADTTHVEAAPVRAPQRPTAPNPQRPEPARPTTAPQQNASTFDGARGYIETERKRLGMSDHDWQWLCKAALGGRLPDDSTLTIDNLRGFYRRLQGLKDRAAAFAFINSPEAWVPEPVTA